MSTHKIGFIGGGMISQIAHLPFYMSDERVHVKSISDSRLSLQTYLKNKFAIEHVCDDHRDILNDDDISSVVIIAPRAATGPLVLEALSAGKNVITEKPMAHSTSQVQKQLDVQKRMNTQYLVGFMKRYDVGIRKGKELFDKVMLTQELGTLIHCRFYDYAKSYAHDIPVHKRPEESRNIRFDTWPLTPEWLPDAFSNQYAWFQNAASHDVNLMRYFFPEGLQLEFAKSFSEDSISSVFSFGKVSVLLELAKSELGKWEQGAEFVFEKGRIRLEIPSPMAIESIGHIIIETNIDGQCIVKEINTYGQWCFAEQAHAFIEHLIAGTPCLTSAEDCLNDMVLIEDMWRSIAKVKTW